MYNSILMWSFPYIYLSKNFYIYIFLKECKLDIVVVGTFLPGKGFDEMSLFPEETKSQFYKRAC